MSSKENNNNDVEGNILKELIEFCNSDDFQIMAERFCIENCHHFTEEEEHRLEYTYLHADFSSLFESHIQQFIDARGVSDRIFFKLLRKAQENNEESAEFINIFLASCEYDAFVHLMRFMKQKMIDLGDPRMINNTVNNNTNDDNIGAKIDEEEGYDGNGDGDDVVVVEGQGMAMLNALMGGGGNNNNKK